MANIRQHGVYADYNATTPLCSQVLTTFKEYQLDVGNMSSGHMYGQHMQERYDQAADSILTCLGAQHYEYFSCGSATEASNWAFYSLLNHVKGCPRVVVSAIEHPCVIEPLKRYAIEGKIDLKVCSVDKNGRVRLEELETLVTENTILVSVILAHNEVGVIQPIMEIAEMAHRVGAQLVSDCVQAVGKMPVNLDTLGIDIAIVSAHKCYAPTGCGALIIKDTNVLKPWILGGTQQQKLRGGTVHVLGVDLFAKGLEYCCQELPNAVDIAAWVKQLKEGVKNIDIIASPDQKNQLWNTVSLAVPGKLSHDLMMQCDVNGVAVATGSACATGAVSESRTLLAMGYSKEVVAGVIRLSFGYPTTQRELDAVASTIKFLEN
jgi:cysteine desulfurase